MELLKDNKTQGGLAHLLQKKIICFSIDYAILSPFRTAVEASCKASYRYQWSDDQLLILNLIHFIF
jgi:hypothetical protein